MSHKKENTVEGAAESSAVHYEMDIAKDGATTSVAVAIELPSTNGPVSSYEMETVGSGHGHDTETVGKMPSTWAVCKLTLKPFGFRGEDVVVEYSSVDELRTKLMGIRPADGYHLDSVRKIEMDGKPVLELMFINPHAACAFYTMRATDRDEMDSLLGLASQKTLKHSVDFGK